MRTDSTVAPPVEALESSLMSFVRGFGLLRPDRTPCGRPLSVSQAHALSEIAARPGLTQRELTEALGLARATVSELLGQLTDRGWITRTTETQDRRQRSLTLTAEGADVAADVASARRTLLSEILADIPSGQHRAVVDAMELLADCVRQRRRAAP